MTRGAAILSVVGCLLLVAPAATAHGAAEPREIDTRILADDDGASGYGICVEGQCAPGSSPQGWDIIVLEGREAALPSGEPVLILRTVFQSPDVQDGRSIAITFKAGGKDHAYGFEAAGPGVVSSTFDALVGPVDAFDGYPKAVDGYILVAKLGLKPGDAVTDIRVTSSFNGEAADIVPGTWFLMGEEVPGAPSEPGLPEEHPAGTYTLAGPAGLVNVTLTKKALDASAASDGASIQASNPLAGTAQFVTLNLSVPEGITATLDQAGLNLEAGATRTAILNVTNATRSGIIVLTLTSDLGAYERIEIPVTGVVTVSTDAGHHGGATDDTGSSEDHHGEEEKGAPGLSMLSIAGLLAVGMVIIRRRL